MTIPNLQQFKELIKQPKFHSDLDNFQDIFTVINSLSGMVTMLLKSKIKNSVTLNSSKVSSMAASKLL